MSEQDGVGQRRGQSPWLPPGVIEGCTRSGRAPESRRGDAGATWMVCPLATALHSTGTRRPDGRPVEWSPASKLHPVRTALARAEATASPPAVAPFKPLLQACVRRAARRDRQPGLFPHCRTFTAHTATAARRGAGLSGALCTTARNCWVLASACIASTKGAPLGHPGSHVTTAALFSPLFALISKVRTACSASRSGASGGARRDDDHTSLTQLALSRPPNEAGRGAETLFTLHRRDLG